MTYNVHSFVGIDGVYHLDRIAQVIQSAGAAVVALQEVDFGRGRTGTAAIEMLADRLGMSWHFTLTRNGLNGHFGNAVLTPHEFELVAEGFLPSRRDEARAVQWLRVVAPTWRLHLMNTHLSISPHDRALQIRALLGAEWMAQADTDLPLVVCGDFNASPFSRVYRELARDLRDVQSCRSRRSATWPSLLPFWCIDHMFVSKDVSVAACRVIRDGPARRASDHLPLVAEIAV
jgi:endonuclease/exonuclease/phosphatase family metal-dependent hydrolase